MAWELIDDEFKQHLECVGLAGQAGGLRTGAMVLRKALESGFEGSLESLADAMEEQADEIEKQSFKLIPTDGMNTN